jgi:putative membrane protein
MPIIWLLVYSLVFVWSGIGAKDYFTWALEVAPAIIGLVMLIMTRNRFPLTRLVYVVILIHCVILMVGGHYTYAEVPFFDYLADVFGWHRNNYDKVGHFAQGFVPALIAREVFVRLKVVNGARWLHVIVVSMCLAISALYELIEWWVALLSGESAEAFLGTQGYIWDTQSDMGFAFIGAIVALVVFGKMHDRQLREMTT